MILKERDRTYEKKTHHRAAAGGGTDPEPDRLRHEKDRRRDKDNICAFGRKVIQDALVKARYLSNDGWKNIRGFEDHFEVDAKNPRIEVEIIGRDEE